MKSEKITHIETEIYSIPLFGKKVGLYNIQQMMDELKDYVNLVNLFDKTKVIHVTGTNGKGSVSSMLSQVYKTQGYKVGLFTSPHIHQVNERVQINNENVSEALFAKGYEVVKKIADKLKVRCVEPTFFEWLFAIALYCFAIEKPDIMIIEVGIGGRLDTTNALPVKDICVLTPIGLDHQDILGNTIKDIAVEKAGIITDGSKVVLYNDNEEVEEVVDKIVLQKKNKYYKVLPNVLKIHKQSLSGIDFSVHNKYYYYEKLRLDVAAGYQMHNAATVLTVIEAMKDLLPVEEASIRLGLKKFHWPGRFERIKEHLIIDGAHNELGISNLLKSIDQVMIHEEADLLIGMKEGKDIVKVIRMIGQAKRFSRYFVVGMTIQKSVSKELIASELRNYAEEVYIVEDLEHFINNYEYDDRTLICTGSLYLISEIRQIALGGL